MYNELAQDFAECAERAILEAERLDCSLEEFRTGLMIMEATIRERINGVKSELDAAGLREDLE